MSPSHNVIPLWINTIKLKKGHDTNNRGQRLLTTEKKNDSCKKLTPSCQLNFRKKSKREFYLEIHLYIP
jgi:hypothetical protein